MDESDVERAQNTGTLMLAASIGRISRSVSAPPRLNAECDDCGGAIPPARLAALRSATRCVDCQESHERRR